MKRSIFTVFLCVALVCICTQGFLFTKKNFPQFNMTKEEIETYLSIDGPATGEVDIPITTCNSTKLGEAWPNTKFTYSGYLKAFNNASNSAFAFLFYGSQLAANLSDVSNYPTIIWLQGGPGGSSQFGNFQEMGPYIFTNTSGNVSLNTPNKYSWNKYYNMLFLDNPIGTGYSFAERTGDVPSNQDEVGSQLLYALDQLYNNEGGCFNQTIPNMAQSPLFIFGESYAGKYVPNIANEILSSKAAIPLKGIGVGDGFTDPKMIQSQMAVWAYNIAFNDMQERSVTQSYIMQGNEYINRDDWFSSHNTFDAIMDKFMNPAGMNDVYNFRNVNNPYDKVDLDTLLNFETLVEAFTFKPNIAFSSQSSTVYNRLYLDFMQRDCVQRLESVLQANLPVLYYNGQNDIIVCSLCTESWLDKVKYNGTDSFQSAQFAPWWVNGQVAGYYKNSSNLAFWTINNAGHMVPADQPQNSLFMVQTFINETLAKMSSSQ